MKKAGKTGHQKDLILKNQNNLKHFYSNHWLLLTARVILSLVFIFAGIEKISDPESFAVAIINYRIFPIFTVNLIAIILPWLELIAGLLLLLGISIKENSAIILTLMSVFTLLIIAAVLRGLDIECGCFGTSDSREVGILKIFENLFLILLSIQLLLFSSESKRKFYLEQHP